jgi:hypothetical protein
MKLRASATAIILSAKKLLNAPFKSFPNPFEILGLGGKTLCLV